MKANIKLQLGRLTPIALLALVRTVVARMTGNANFPTPAVDLAELAAKADELEVAIEAATNGSRQSRLERDQLVLEVQDLLRVQADYVRSVALYDAVVLASSGFELRKQPEAFGIPGVAKKMEVRMTGLRGDLDLRWSSVPGAHGYQVWMTDKDPELFSSWTAIGYTTRVRHNVTDLESYKAYWFCVSAIGVAGEGAQCDPALGRAA